MTVELSIDVPGSHGRMDAEAVLQTLNRILRTAAELEIAQVGGAEATPRSRWRFTELGLASVHATIAPLEVRGPATEEVLDTVVLRLITGFTRAETESVIPDGWSPDVAKRARSVASGLKGDLVAGVVLGLVREGQPVDDVPPAHITGRTAVNLKEALAIRQETIGSVAGTLGSINVHRRNVAGLWPERGGARLEVTFHEDDLDRMRDALGHRVLVAGRLKRNAAGQVVRLQLRKLERLPEDGEGMRELYGLDPTLSGDLSTLEYLREIRGAS